MHATSEHWWDCPLDAQRLAMESVDAAVSAARLCAGGGSASRITTTGQLARGAFETISLMRVDGQPVHPWAEFSGFFAANDGFVRLHGNYPHHAEAIRRALRVASRDELERAIAATGAQEVEEAIVSAGGIATRVRSEAEWREHPQHRAVADDEWLEIEPGGERSALPAAGAGEGSPLPLSGVRVLDLTRVIAGPTCTQLLACLGAEVLRIDPPHRPELLDQFLSNGMGKRSAVADLGSARIGELLRTADVVVLGYRPESLGSFGLSPETLLRERPELVVASLSAWGEHGPWGERAGFDSIVQAASGIAMRCARGGEPGALPVQALDFSTGYMLASGVMRLLGEGRGGLVRASLLGAARRLLGYPPRDGTASGTPSSGSFSPLLVPVESPHGELTLPPPPLLIDGRTIEAAAGGYGAAELAWR